MRTFLIVAMILFSAGTSLAQSITGRITDAASGVPLPGARVSLSDGTHSTVANADGTYRLAVGQGTRVLRVSLLGHAPVTDTLVVGAAGATHDFSLVSSGVQLDASVVIGSRMQDRTVFTAPVPVDVFTKTEVTGTGAVETGQIIQLLAPSFNFYRATISDGSDHVRPATLRGLGSDQVLVLINGKRRHTSALVNLNGKVGRGSANVDFNAIPSGSIERIEILRDGAAAQYGSDAIAGVINIILKSDAATNAGVEIGSDYTRLPNYPTDETLTDGDLSSVDMNTGMNFRDGGFLHVSGQYNNRGSTNRTLPDTRVQYFAGDPKNNDPAYRNRIDYKQGDPRVNDTQLVLNWALPTFSGGAQLYGFASGSRRNGSAAANWRQPSNNNNVRAIYPDGFLPVIGSTINDYASTVGAHGDMHGWKYDLSETYGHDSFALDVSNSVNPSLGAASPTEFYAGQFTFGQSTTNLDLVRAVKMSSLEPINVAVGAELRHDTYGIGAGEPDSYRDGGVPVLDGPSAGAKTVPGAQSFPGFQPKDAGNHGRSNIAGYVDLETSFFKNLMVGAAARSEHYSDFGGTTTGKVTGRYEVAPGVAIRAAASTGFRAPSLGQEFMSSTATTFINVGAERVAVDVRTLPVGSGTAKALGAVPLKAEKSVNGSIGVALAPTAALSLSADYYNIRIRNRIVLSGNFTGTAMTAFLAAQGFPGVGSARFFTNAIDTHTAGVDIVARYAWDLGPYGVTRITGGFNKTRNRVTRVAATPPALASQQAVLFDRVERGRIEEGQPGQTVSINIDHTTDRFGATVHVQRFGSVEDRATTAALDQRYGAKWITDVSASYRVIRQMQLTVGSNNLLDVYPDRNLPGNSSSGVFPYSQISPFGFNGRFIYAKVRFERL